VVWHNVELTTLFVKISAPKLSAGGENTITRQIGVFTFQWYFKVDRYYCAEIFPGLPDWTSRYGR
jgi:hypothetical protein